LIALFVVGLWAGVQGGSVMLLIMSVVILYFIFGLCGILIIIFSLQKISKNKEDFVKIKLPLKN